MKKYQGSARARRQKLQALCGDFKAIQMKSRESIIDYFAGVITIVDKMHTYGDRTKETTVVDYILQSLVPKFNFAVCAIEE